MLPLTIDSFSAILIASSSLSFDAPTAGPSQLISLGPEDKPVNETAVAACVIDNVEYLLAMWQVQDPPSGGLIEVPVKLAYAIGAINPTTGAITWDEIGDVPQPDGYVTMDPAATGIFKSNIDPGGFVGAGVAVDDDIPSAFITLTGVGETTFEAFDPTHHFDCCEGCEEDALVRNTRLGAWVENGNVAVPISYLLARSVDPEEACAEFHQILMRASESDWSAFTDWIPVVVDNQAIKGFPSSPRFQSPGLVDVVHFSYADIDAEYIRACGAVHDINDPPAFEDLGLDVNPVLPVGGSDTYFTAAEPLIADDFQIGPFTSMDVSNDGEYAYVVYHDLVSAPSGGEAQFRAYVRVGDGDGDEYIWSSRIAIDNDVTHEAADQFMPVACVDNNGRLHVAWYDTRGDYQDDGEDVEIGLWYPHADEPVTGSNSFTPLQLGEDVIHSGFLSNPKFIGDYISITMTPDESEAVIVFMGTSHPNEQGPQGFGDPEPTQENEAIYSWRVIQ